MITNTIWMFTYSRKFAKMLYSFIYLMPFDPYSRQNFQTASKTSGYWYTHCFTQYSIKHKSRYWRIFTDALKESNQLTLIWVLSRWAWINHMSPLNLVIERVERQEVREIQSMRKIHCVITGFEEATWQEVHGFQDESDPLLTTSKKSRFSKSTQLSNWILPQAQELERGPRAPDDIEAWYHGFRLLRPWMEN